MGYTNLSLSLSLSLSLPLCLSFIPLSLSLSLSLSLHLSIHLSIHLSTFHQSDLSIRSIYQSTISIHPSFYRHASDSTHSGSKEAPSLSHSTVGMGFLRQLDPFGTWPGFGRGSAPGLGLGSGPNQLEPRGHRPLVGLPPQGERVEGELPRDVAVPAQRCLSLEGERRAAEGGLTQRLVRTRQPCPRRGSRV